VAGEDRRSSPTQQTFRVYYKVKTSSPMSILLNLRRKSF
jgi:hypothetical protein